MANEKLVTLNYLQSFLEKLFVKKVVSNNIDNTYDTSNKLVGYLGNETNTSYCRAIFPIIPGKTYYWDANLGGFGVGGGRLFYYCDKNGNYLSAIQSASLVEGSDRIVYVTIPNDTQYKYLILSWYSSGAMTPGSNTSKGFYVDEYKSTYEFYLEDFYLKEKYLPLIESLNCDFLEPLNLWNDDEKTNNHYLDNAGVDNSNSSYMYSGYIRVKPGDSYIWKYNQPALGCMYDENKNIMRGILTATTISGSYSILKIPNGVAYVRLNYLNTETQPMVIKGTTYPDSYLPYGYKLKNVEISDADWTKINNLINSHSISFETSKSINLLDPYDEDVIIGKYFMPGGNQESSSGAFISGYIEIDPTKSYMLTVNAGFYGATNVNIQVYDANKNRLGGIAGNSTNVTVTDFVSEDLGTYKIMIIGNAINSYYASAKYIRMTFFNGSPNSYQNRTKYQFVEGSSSSNFPTTYKPFFNKKSLTNDISLNETQEEETFGASNKLIGKTIIFDGDSICNASSAGSEDGGWARRIGESNKMNWYNRGIGGGTIGKYTGHTSHYCISEDYVNYPSDVDYIILEGGTNDADIISSDSNLSMGTFDATDWSGNYTNDTFCGAFEYMIYHIIQTFPQAKIGYIVAPKMGYAGTGTTKNYGSGDNRYNYFLKAMEICKKWGIPVINLWDESPLNPMLSAQFNRESGGTQPNTALYTDGQHLTTLGYDRIWKTIDSFVKSL